MKDSLHVAYYNYLRLFKKNTSFYIYVQWSYFVFIANPQKQTQHFSSLSIIVERLKQAHKQMDIIQPFIILDCLKSAHQQNNSFHVLSFQIV